MITEAGKMEKTETENFDW